MSSGKSEWAITTGKGFLGVAAIFIFVGFIIGWNVQGSRHKNDICDFVWKNYDTLTVAMKDGAAFDEVMSTDPKYWQYLKTEYGQPLAETIMKETRFARERPPYLMEKIVYETCGERPILR